MIEDQEIPSDTVFLDKYQVKEKLGKGSFGVVYDGIDIKTNKKVAIKLVFLINIRNREQKGHNCLKLKLTTCRT